MRRLWHAVAMLSMVLTIQGVAYGLMFEEAPWWTPAGALGWLMWAREARIRLLALDTPAQGG